MKFSDFFKNEPIEIDVISGLREIEKCPEIVSTLLCRDFCLTVGDDEGQDDSFVILAGSSPADCYQIEDKPPKSFMINSAREWRFIENDSHTAFPNLDHVTFFLVSLKTMRVVDFLHFKYEFIYLAHHLGVGLRENQFSVLSMKNQRIFLFEIDKETEKFIQKDEISRNTYKAEPILQSSKTVGERDDSWGCSGISGLILKLIKYLIDHVGLKEIPCPYSILLSLHIWKHQLLPDNKILMRLVPSTVILSTNPRHQSMVHALDPLPSIHKNSFLVVYDLVEERVESVLNSADDGLLEWMKNNWGWLRGRTGDSDSFETALLAIKRGYQDEEGINNAIVRRFTNTLPQAPQQLTDSPYFDSSNFRWDPKITAVLSKQTPISCNYFMNSDAVTGASGLYECNYGPAKIKFFSRSRPNMLSHSLRFVDESMLADGVGEGAGMDRHKWINVMFHPTLPLVVVYQYGIFRALTLRIFYN